MSGKPLILVLVGFLITTSLSAQTTIPPGSVYGTWEASGSPYLIEGQIAVPPDSTLIIEPGVEVIFQWWYIFYVYGYLQAVGSETDSILFTPSDSAIGWRGIMLINAPDSSHFTYCILQYSRIWPPYSHTSGSLICDRSNPVITHCTFRHNTTEFGGGIWCSNGNPFISHCMFYSNNADAGGGISCGGSNPYIGDCLFRGNFANYGGAINCSGSNPTIVNCNFINNSAEWGGALVFGSEGEDSSSILNCNFTNNHSVHPGGAARIFSTITPISNCTFIHNSTTYQGGALHLGYSHNTVSNCTFSNNSASGISIQSGNPTISFCVIDSNQYGGIVIDELSDPTIDHCTITRNSMFGIDCRNFYSIMRNPIISNTIIEGNYGNVGGICASQYCQPFVQYCDVSNNLPANFTGEIPDSLGEIITVNANGDSCDAFFNIFLDPLFVDTTSGDYRLQSDSPCIDAGDPTSPLDPDSTVTDIGAFFYDQLWVKDSFESPTLSEFHLSQNYPNPFNASTIISYNLPQTDQITLNIYNILGQRVSTLYNDLQYAGHHQAIWKAIDVASGVYIAQLQSSSQVKSIKLLLLK